MFRSDFPDKISFRGITWHDDQIFTVDNVTFQIRQICCNGRTPLIRLGPVNSVGTSKTFFVNRTELWQVLNYGLDVLHPTVINMVRNYQGV